MRPIPVTTLILSILLGPTLSARAGTVPAAPPGASATTTSFTSPLSVQILDEQSNHSPLEVAGVQGQIWDVNVVTNIAHTFSPDLAVRLTAPSGTVVTLSTNNVAPLFGVTFDDSAPTPITLALGPVANLAPEGALAALMGEDPNGTWVLDCEDQALLDTGAFTWTIEITTLDAALVRTMHVFSSIEAVNVPTFDSVFTVIDVPTAGFVCDVDVRAHVYAERVDDLELRLIAAGGGLEAFLAEGPFGPSNTFANVWFDDSAPVPVTDAPIGRLDEVVPAGALGRMVATDLAQPWRLVVTNLGTDNASILGWDLVVTTCAVASVQTLCTGQAPAPCPCGNQGSADGGCANALHAGGARLAADVAAGGPRLGDDTRLVAQDLEPFQVCIFVQGTQTLAGGLGTPLGDGLLCAGGSVVRLGARLTGFGSASYPGLFDVPLSTRGLLPPGGGTRFYQVIQRSSVLLGPCHTGLNSTNAVRIGWAP
jgi:subtilisin-like proprotein convertase family protein